MGWFHKSAVSALVLVIMGFELWAILGPREDWPLTSGAMFAFYVTPESDLYRIDIYAERDGERAALRPRVDVGLGARSLRRLLFSAYYGSTDPRFPQGHHIGDTPEGFRRRIEDFLDRLASIMIRRGRAPETLELEVVRVSSDGTTILERKVVGTYRANDS